MPTASTSGRSSNGLPMLASPSLRPRVLTSSSTGVPWKRGDWLLQRSTGATRRYAASTGSPTSTAGSAPTQPSTSGVPRFTPLRAAARPNGVRDLPVHGPTARQKPHRPRRAAGPQRSTGQRTLRDQYRGPRLHPGTPHASDYGQGKQAGHHSPGAAGGPGHRLAIGERSEGPILRRRDGKRLDRRAAHRWVRSIGKQAGLSAVYLHMLRSAFIMAALDAGVPLRDVQIAARRADPRSTTVYDRRRETFDRHAAYVVVAFVAGG